MPQGRSRRRRGGGGGGVGVGKGAGTGAHVHFALDGKVLERLQLREALRERLLYVTAAKELATLLSAAYAQSSKEVQAALAELTLQALAEQVEALSRAGAWESSQAAAALLLQRQALRSLPKQRRQAVASAYKQACLLHASRTRRHHPGQEEAAAAEAEAPPCSMPSLPREVQFCVASFLDIRSLLALSCVDRSWREALSSEEQLWLMACRRHCEEEGCCITMLTRTLPALGAVTGGQRQPSCRSRVIEFLRRRPNLAARLVAPRGQCPTCKQLVWRHTDRGSSISKCLCSSRLSTVKKQVSWGRRHNEVLRWIMHESYQAMASNSDTDSGIESLGASVDSSSDRTDSEGEVDDSSQAYSTKTGLGSLWRQVQVDKYTDLYSDEQRARKYSSKAALSLASCIQDLTL